MEGDATVPGPDGNRPQLSLVIPAWNSGRYLPANVAAVLAFFDASGIEGEVIIADPFDAYDRLNAIPVEERGGAVFFAMGQRPQTGTVTATATGTRLFTGIDHRGRWRLREEPDGRTRVELRLSYQAPGGVLGLVSDSRRVVETPSLAPRTKTPEAASGIGPVSSFGSEGS